MRCGSACIPIGGGEGPAAFAWAIGTGGAGAAFVCGIAGCAIGAGPALEPGAPGEIPGGDAGALP